jgi:phage terminase large subunit-like protein
VFAEELRKAREIRDGKREGAMLPVLYEFPKEVQESPDRRWEDPALWPLVTPNLGKSITVQRLQADHADAKATSESELRVWASQHLNIQIGQALMADGWVGADFWDDAGDASVDLEALLERAEVAVVGIDGGGLDDLLGLCVIGRERGTRKWLHWAHAWAHEIVLDRRKQLEPKLRDLEACGDLTIVESPGEDVTELAEIVRRVGKAKLLPEKLAIGVDAAGIGAIVDELTQPGSGITLEQVVAVSQGWKLNGAIKTAERAIAGGDLVHGAQPLMAWAVANAKVEPKGNAITITKQASGSAKIDPLMATFNAVSLMALNPAAQKKKLVLMSLG